MGKENQLLLERQHLDTVRETIDRQIEEIKKFTPGTSSHRSTAQLLSDQNATSINDYVTARPRPFDGRVTGSFSDTGEEFDYYIGSKGLSGPGSKILVLSWASGMATLYYAPEQGVVRYRNPSDGFICTRNAKVNLSRAFFYKNEMLDDYRDRLNTLDEGLNESFIDRSFITPTTGSVQLTQAVATLTPAQYQNIAMLDQKVMLIQGSAGSGKSLIGLHRLAYLLSPANVLTEKPNEERVVFFGPSKAFFQYARELLPSLGHPKIKQITVDEWMRSLFIGKKPRVVPSDKLLVRMMGNRNVPTAEEMEIERFKSSVMMKNIIFHHFSNVRNDMIKKAGELSLITVNGCNYMIPHKQAKEIVRKLCDPPFQPFNEIRRVILERLAKLAWENTNGKNHSDTYFHHKEAIMGGIANAMKWPHRTSEEVYINLLNASDYFIKCSQGLRGAYNITLDFATSLKNTLPALALDGSLRPFQSSDIPSLLYIDHLLEPHRSANFEHVVIDEAQDLSPLELYIIKMHTSKQNINYGGFTILGDLPQRLLPYKGIDRWGDFRSVFGSEYTPHTAIRESVRSTKEITGYANKVLRRILTNIDPPVANERSGDRVILRRDTNQRSMYKHVLETATNFAAAGMTVGILTRNLPDAKKIFAMTDFNQEFNNFVPALLTTHDDELGIYITIAPIVLSKGLEFDRVLIVGADADSFEGTEMDNRLFYLACTRARQGLEIHWSGKVSPLIEDVGTRGTETVGHITF